MKSNQLLITILLLSRTASAADLDFGHEVIMPDGTKIVASVASVDNAETIAEYAEHLRETYQNADPRVIRPSAPRELSEIAVIQRVETAETKSWRYVCPLINPGEQNNPMLPRPRAVFLLPEPGRLLLIWQVDRKLIARELETGVPYENQTQPATDLILLRSFDALKSIGDLTQTDNGELELTISVDGREVRLRRLESGWQAVD